MTHERDRLIDAFRQDHAVLGRGFHDLSQRLRTGDIAGACAAAAVLNRNAGAHIAFEEDDFYPALIPLIGEPDVRRMYDEHGAGLALMRRLISLDPQSPPPPERCRELLHQSEAMETHIAECGELFGAMGRIPADQQAALYRRLLALRDERPTWLDVARARQARKCRSREA